MELVCLLVRADKSVTAQVSVSALTEKNGTAAHASQNKLYVPNQNHQAVICVYLANGNLIQSIVQVILILIQIPVNVSQMNLTLLLVPVVKSGTAVPVSALTERRTLMGAVKNLVLAVKYVTVPAFVNVLQTNLSGMAVSVHQRLLIVQAKPLAEKNVIQPQARGEISPVSAVNVMPSKIENGARLSAVVSYHHEK